MTTSLMIEMGWRYLGIGVFLHCIYVKNRQLRKVNLENKLVFNKALI